VRLPSKLSGFYVQIACQKVFSKCESAYILDRCGKDDTLPVVNAKYCCSCFVLETQLFRQTARFDKLQPVRKIAAVVDRKALRLAQKQAFGTQVMNCLSKA